MTTAVMVRESVFDVEGAALRAEAELDATGRHQMRIMSPEDGDLKYTWDPDSKDEVTMAEENFDKAKKRGMVAYNVDKKGEKTTVLDEFDAKARCIIFAPAPMRG